MKLSAISAVLILILTGCAHRPSEMPIGIFDPPLRVFPELADSGFNLIVAPASQTTLERAHKSGLSVLMTGGTDLLSRNDPRALIDLDRHPAAFGWYLWDEPDLHQISPRRVRGENLRLKRHAGKQTILVLASGAAVEKYAGITEVLAVDWYPVPWSSVGTVVREMRLARLGADGQPFLAILQAFDWSAARDLLETEVPLRAPTPEELRCMTYLALMQGAAGMIFYAYEAAAWNLETNQPLRRAVFQIASEIRGRSSAFGERVEWWPAQTQNHGPPGTMFNEIGEARVSLALFRSRGAGNSYYFFAVNTTDQPTDFSFKLPFKGVGQVATFCAENKFQVEDGWVRKTYAPFEVCVFGPIKGKLADE